MVKLDISKGLHENIELEWISRSFIYPMDYYNILFGFSICTEMGYIHNECEKRN